MSTSYSSTARAAYTHLGLRPLQDHSQRRKFKQTYKKRTDLVKDAMSAVPYGDQKAMSRPSPRRLERAACSRSTSTLCRPRSARTATSGCPGATGRDEFHLHERRAPARLTVRMDPPGQAMPDCLIAARLANNLERRVPGNQQSQAIADKFKGFDWKTEEARSWTVITPTPKGGEFATLVNGSAPWAPTACRNPRDRLRETASCVGTEASLRRSTSWGGERKDGESEA